MPQKSETRAVKARASRNSCGGCFRDFFSPRTLPRQFLFAAHEICPELATVAAPAFSEVLKMPKAGLIAIARYYDGQHYQLTGFEPLTRQDGTKTVLACWASNCAECGQPFPLATVARATKFSPNRRCQRCKRPGVRVKGGRHGRS